LAKQNNGKEQNRGNPGGITSCFAETNKKKKRIRNGRKPYLPETSIRQSRTVRAENKRPKKVKLVEKEKDVKKLRSAERHGSKKCEKYQKKNWMGQKGRHSKKKRKKRAPEWVEGKCLGTD